METQIRKAATSMRRRSTRVANAKSRATDDDAVISVVKHRQLISETAYFLAEKRGFAPGHELEDWLSAEAEVDALRLARLASQSVDEPRRES